VPPKYATEAGKGTASFGDSFKEKRHPKENSQPSWPEKYGITDIDGRVLPSLRTQHGAPNLGADQLPWVLFRPPDPLIVEFVEVADLALLIRRIPYMTGVLGLEAALNLRNVVAILIDNPCEIADLGRIAP
jgi:hypothetical protein